MNSFQTASEIEKQAEAILLPYMEKTWPDCTYYPTRHHALIQLLEGDVLVSRNGGSKYIEIKAERENRYGNLFIETYSNRARGTSGWFFKLNADWLWYYFLAPSELYIVSMGKLRDWADERLGDFEERRQKRYDQLNDTWGRCVPIEVLKTECNGFTGPIDPTL